MTQLTIYKNITEVKNGFEISLEMALDRIVKGNSKEAILKLSSLSDDEAKALKKNLPCVMFNGTFTERYNKFLVKASQFAVVDFDNTKHTDNPFDEAVKLREDLRNDDYIYSAWLSPSLKGVKALIKIPLVKDDTEYKTYYGAIINYYAGLGDSNKELDVSNKNIARVCYESYDDKLWINKDSKLWEEKLIEEEVKKPQSNAFNLPDNTQHPYIKKAISNTIQIAVGMIANAGSGEKHLMLRDSTILLGGYVPHYISEAEAVSHLSFACESNNYDNNNNYSYSKTIEDCMVMGINKPITIDIPVKDNSLVEGKNYNSFNKISERKINPLDFISKENNGWNKLNDFYDGKIELGVRTGIEFLDRHFMWKKNEFYGWSSPKGRGKSILSLTLSLFPAIISDWKFIVASQENMIEDIKEILFNAYVGNEYKQMRNIESLKETTREAIDFIEKHYVFLNDNVNTVEESLVTAKHIVNNDLESDYVLILDPINTFMSGFDYGHKQIEYSNGAEIAKRVLDFSKETCTVFMTQHTIMSKQRESGGVIRSADAEGGWWLNKMSFTMTSNREQGSSDNIIQIDNVRNTKTGGSETKPDEPLVFEWSKTALHISLKDTVLKQMYAVDYVKKNLETIRAINKKGEVISNVEPLSETQLPRLEANKDLWDNDVPDVFDDKEEDENMPF